MSMNKYIDQLLEDIAYAAENLSFPFNTRKLDWRDWLTEEEEDKIAPVRNLEEWTGIQQVMLPPPDMLTDDQVHQLLTALTELLIDCNWAFVLQNEVPERIQYATIRDNFNQEVKLKQWNDGFFQVCRPGTEHGKCSLKEYCQCRFFTELFGHLSNEELSPERERAMELECEIQHLKRKYGDDWMKYYPYHLDPEYDDENGNPFDYGFGDEEEEDDEDNWWRS